MKTKTCKFCKQEFEPQLLPSGRYSKSNFCCKECEHNYNKQFLITKTRVCEYIVIKHFKFLEQIVVKVSAQLNIVLMNVMLMH